VAQALYRKWRSQTFDEVVGQEHVVRTLTSALAQSRIAHAYLFTGPRGTGKTTTARLLAKAVNCLAEDGPKPCNQCQICQALNEGRLLDLIEIDGASNRGIDEVRALREQVNFSPNVARYKVYIIDEVHMLTPEAFNALLKTLEEPPSHVIFVLATTEPHKLPPTIISRCQRFDFRRIPLNLIIQHLRHIADAEGLNVEDGALELIARSATGSMRDAISLLDQLSAYGSETITHDLVQSMLGAVATEPLAELIDHILQRDLKGALGLLTQLVDQGLDPRQLTSELLDYVRDLLQVKAGNAPSLTAMTASTEERMRSQATALSTGEILAIARLLTKASVDVKGNILSQLPLELAITEAVLEPEAAAPPAPQQPAPVAPAPKPTPRTAPPAEAKSAKPIAAPAQESVQPKTVAPEASAPPPAPTVAVESGSGTLALHTVRQRWVDIVEGMRAYNPRSVALSTQAVLRSGYPLDVKSDILSLGFPSEFHKNQMNEPGAKALVEKAIADTLGLPGCTIRPVLTPPQKLKEAREAAATAPPPRQPAPKKDGPDKASIGDALLEHAVNEYGAVLKEVAPEDAPTTTQEEAQ